MTTHARITKDPETAGGMARIRDTRIPVATVLGMLADGMSTPEILAAYPSLEQEDVAAALAYAYSSAATAAAYDKYPLCSYGHCGCYPDFECCVCGAQPPVRDE